MPEFAAVIVIAVIIIAITAKRNELCEIEVGRYAGLSFCWNLMEKQQNRARKTKGKTTKNHTSNY